MKTNPLFIVILFWGALAVAPTVRASATDGNGDFYWTGAADLNFENAANWVFGTPTGVVPSVPPKNYDNQVNVYLRDGLAPVKNANLTMTRSVEKVFLTNATDWVIGGSSYTLTLKQIQTFGVGTNTFECIVKTGGGTLTFTVRPGGRVVFNSGTYHDGGIVFTGGGEFFLSLEMSGWSNSRVATVTGNTLLRSATASFFRSVTGAYIYLNGRYARLQYKTTVAAAKAKFGLTANGSAGIVNGYKPEYYKLYARDIGGGFVEVGIEPKAISLLVF